MAELVLDYLRFADCYYWKRGTVTDEMAGIKAALRPVRELYAHTPAAEFGPLVLRAVQRRMVELDSGRPRPTGRLVSGRIEVRAVLEDHPAAEEFR